MKEIIDSIDSRIKSPLFGYYLVALISINWRAFFFLFFDNGLAIDRIEYFRLNTNYLTLFIYPTLAACGYSIIYPWINYFFLLCSQTPNEYKNTLQARSEDKLLTIQQQLEQKRAKLLAQQKENLIAQTEQDKVMKEQKIEEEPKKLLNDSQINILQILGKHTKGVVKDSLFSDLKEDDITNQYNIDQLVNSNIISISWKSGRGNVAEITAKGRAYLVENGLID